MQAVSGAPVSTGATDVGAGAYTAPASVTAGNIGQMAAGPDQASAFAQSGSGGGGGGAAGAAGAAGGEGGAGGMASLLPMLAMLADGGSVNLGSPSYSAPSAVAPCSTGQMSAGPDQAAAFKQDASKKSDSSSGPQSQLGKSAQSSAPTQATSGGGGGGGKPSFMSAMAHGGAAKMANALVSPGEKYLDKAAVRKVDAGADPMKVGATIPGKPNVGGAKNSFKNDTVPAKLEAGGIVIPRSITQAMNPGAEAKKFVEAILKKQSKGMK
jgi:hypothetical protein